MQSDALLWRGDDARAALRQVIRELRETRERVRRVTVQYRRRKGSGWLCPSDRQYMDLRLVLDSRGEIIGSIAPAVGTIQPPDRSGGRCTPSLSKNLTQRPKATPIPDIAGCITLRE